MDTEALRKSRKLAGYAVVLLAYLTAGFMVWLVYDAVSIFHPVLVVFILDMVATLTIFLFSMGFNNSSIYDPYWSVAPPVIIAFWLLEGYSWQEFTPLHWIILILVLAWSVRLTMNWLSRWKGIRDEDWRYISFRFKFTEHYWLVSLFAIHLFPTLVVFLACLPVYPALVLGDGNMGLMEWIAAAITFSGIMIEGIADRQLSKYICNKSKFNFLSSGLWKYSRHPNYFGELLFWTGIFLFSTGLPELFWWILPGPVIMILLFHFFSIPAIDRRMLRRKTGYRDYLKRTSALVPWIPGSPPGKHTAGSG